MNPNLENQNQAVCPKCQKASVVSHNGGQWCPLCGVFATPPKPRGTTGVEELPASHASPFLALAEEAERIAGLPRCASCFQPVEPGFGIYDDGEWTCGVCLGLC
jgi:hypothetical protein